MQQTRGLGECAPMKLVELVQGVAGARLQGDPSIRIDGLAYHTRDVGPGILFFCVPGQRADGRSFAAAAAAAGAAALVCEAPVAEQRVTQVIVPSARRALALMAAHWYGEPSRELLVAGVTGTNGKTTTTHLIAAIAAAAGRQAALLGTVVNRIGGVDYPVQLTTAESLDLQRMFRQMVDAGDQACALEISSHALVLDRSVGITFDAVVFTNLTRDHLDFHRDLDDYYLAKRRLFLPDERRNGDAVAVINVGDGFGERLAAECAAVYGDALWTYAVAGSEPAGATVAASACDLDLDADSSAFTLVVPRLGLAERLTLPLAARFNVENALAAAATALAVGLPIAAVREGLAHVRGVPGRFEAVREGQPFAVVVDYSHTPDSLENALMAARAVSGGRVLVVFGCGGDRDRGKRPLMGGIGALLADRTYITSDNPRSEDPQAILADIVAGIAEERMHAVTVEADRRAAIRLALGAAQPGDVVLIAGKGHEQGQQIGDRRIPFDDRKVAREVLRELRRGQ